MRALPWHRQEPEMEAMMLAINEVAATKEVPRGGREGVQEGSESVTM